MNNDKEKAIRDFIKNAQSDTKRENIPPLLWDIICDALMGQSISKFKSPRAQKHALKFLLRYSETCHDKSKSLPEEVEFNRTRKDFHEVLFELVSHINLKINEGDVKTCDALKKSPIDRIKWIRTTLSQILTNKIFNYEIKEWRKVQPEIDKRLEEWKMSDEWRRIAAEERIEAETRKRNIIWGELRSSGGKIVDGGIEIPLELEREGREGTYLVNRQDAEVAEEFWTTYYEHLKDEEPRIDVIKWQHEAFFWRPGEEFQGKMLEGTKRAVYIAFFYSWLRRCSHATFEEIAQETGVSKSTPDRNWKPHPDLKEPFPDPFDDTGGWLDEIFEYPVYFHSDARTSIGMYDKKISRYSRMDYDERGEYYPPILRRKEIIWRIYCMLRDLKEIRIAKINYDAKLYGDFSFDIISSKRLGISQKRGKSSSFLHITSIGVNNA